MWYTVNEETSKNLQPAAKGSDSPPTAIPENTAAPSTGTSDVMEESAAAVSSQISYLASIKQNPSSIFFDSIHFAATDNNVSSTSTAC